MPYATSLCPPGSLSALGSPTSGPRQGWPAALLYKDGQADAQDRTLSSLARGTATPYCPRPIQCQCGRRTELRATGCDDEPRCASYELEPVQRTRPDRRARDGSAGFRGPPGSSRRTG